MAQLKTLGKLLLALILGYILGNFWMITRPEDPIYYPYLIGAGGALVSFLILYYSGQE